LEDAIKGFTGTLYLNHGVNSDSGLTVALPNEKYLKNHEINKDTLHNLLAESRVIKNDEEILAMRWAS
jgi:Xaa-Pro aminopeptidase